MVTWGRTQNSNINRKCVTSCVQAALCSQGDTFHKDRGEYCGAIWEEPRNAKINLAQQENSFVQYDFEKQEISQISTLSCKSYINEQGKTNKCGLFSSLGRSLAVKQNIQTGGFCYYSNGQTWTHPTYRISAFPKVNLKEQNQFSVTGKVSP